MTGQVTDAVLLMTYGSPSSLDDVERYMTAIRGGRVPEHGLVTEFRRRYATIGGSPLIPITERQVAALEARLEGSAVVRAAMRFSEPSIETVMGELAAVGVRRAIGIILSPQYSPLLMGGYARALVAAAERLGESAPAIELAGEWWREPAFVEALASRIRSRLASSPRERRETTVLLTAHSLPRRVAEMEPDYLAQLSATAELVADAAGLTADGWRFCWQSAGHEPGEWMKPDFAELLPALRAAGVREVLVAPIQFLADHLEILYDIDVAAREQANAVGLEFGRIESLNDEPRFIDALEAVARRTLAPVVA
jgi:ferrochelatase